MSFPPPAPESIALVEILVNNMGLGIYRAFAATPSAGPPDQQADDGKTVTPPKLRG